MRLLLWIIGSVAALVIALAAIVPFMIPTETVRAQVIRQVESATGYQLRVDGDVSIGLIPSIRLTARDVGVSVPGSNGPEFVTAGETRFGLGLAGLLSGNAQVTEIALIEPNIVLRTDPFGINNYTVRPEGETPVNLPSSRFERVPAQPVPGTGRPAPPPAPTPVQPTPAGDPQTESGPLGFLSDVSIESLRIERGTVLIHNMLEDSRTEITTLDINASMPSLDSALSFRASAELGGNPYGIEAQVDRPRALLETGTTPISLVLEAGQLLTEPLEIRASPRRSGQLINFDDAEISLGENRIGGNLEIDLNDERPRISGDITGPLLDLDSLAAIGNVRTFNSTRTIPAVNGTGPVEPSVQRIAQTGSATSADTLSDVEIDFSALEAADVSLGLSLDEVRVAGMTLKPVVGAIEASGGVLRAQIDLLGIAKGSVTGNLRVDPTQAEPLIEGHLRGADIELADFAHFTPAERLQGRVAMDMSFATAGHSERAMRERMNAAGELRVWDAVALGLGLSDRFTDPRADRIDDIGIVVSAASLDQPITVRGGGLWRGETLSLDAEMAAGRWIAGETEGTVPVSARLTSNRLMLGYDGQVGLEGTAAGTISIRTPSLRGLLAWLEQPVGSGGGLEAFAFSGGLDIEADRVVFSGADLSIDNTSGSGSGTITFGDVPAIDATLNLTSLDITPYLVSAGGEGGGSQNRSSPGRAAGDPSPISQPSVQQTRSTQSRNRGTDAPWSTEPIDLSGLRAVNADLRLSSQTFIYDDIRTGPVAIDVALAGGVLTTTLNQLQLYDGTGRGAVTIDASGGTPALDANFDLSGLNAGPFLNDAASFDRIEGTANMSFDVQSAGASEAALVSALNGQARVLFEDGAIRGINIPKMMRSLASGVLFGWQDQPDEKTDFAELGGDFQITNGIAVTENLRLIGPLVRMTGTGAADMPQKTLNFRVDPQVVATLQGQAAEGQFEGLGVPVNVERPWSNPRIYPDIQGILQNPDAAYRQLRELGGGLFKNLPDDLGGQSLNSVGDAIGTRIEQETGVSLDGVIQDGNVDERLLRERGREALRNLLGGQTRTAPADEQTLQADDAPSAPDGSDQTQTDQAQQPDSQELQLEDAANELLRGLFGNSN